jgi:diadenylate cyclase
LELFWVLENLQPTDLIDILLVALVFYGASFFIRGTQAVALLRGMVLVLVSMLVISSVFNLLALRWLLENTLVVLGIAIPVIFQPELRRALEQLGRAGRLLNRQAPDSVRAKVIEEVVQAAEKLSERRHGALIVLQRNSSLQEYIRTGIPLNSEVTAQLLLTIFWPKTELHDGAAIVNQQGRLASATSVLPLTSSRNMPDPKLGTRHRAAIGMSEVSDAVVVVVSEETGRISIANAGRLIPRLDSRRLQTVLNALYGEESRQSASPLAHVNDQVQRLLKFLRREQV